MQTTIHPHKIARRLPEHMLLRHTCCWVIFISFELAAIGYKAGKLHFSISYLIPYAINISLFYTHAALLSWSALCPRRNSFLLAVAFLMMVSVAMLVKSLADTLMATGRVDQFAVLGKRYLADNLFRTVYFMILSTFYWLATRIRTYRERQLNAEAAAQRARFAFLQQQLNPHMLFNLLSMTYTAVYKVSPATAGTMMLLSDLMRYKLTAAANDDWVLLATEYEQLTKLIELNSARYEGHAPLQLEVIGTIGDQCLLPLILFTLVENIFVHGNLTQQDPAAAKLDLLHPGRLEFSTKNLKRLVSRQRSSGIGLLNTRQRLDYAYQGRYVLQVQEDERYFETFLILPL